MQICVFGHMQTAKAQISMRIYASAQSDQGLRCPQTEFMDNRPIECFNGEQMHGRDFAHVQDGVNPRILSIYGQRKPRSACASAQSDQVLRCPQTDFFGYYRMFQRRANARMRLRMCIYEGIFTLDSA